MQLALLCLEDLQGLGVQKILLATKYSKFELKPNTEFAHQLLVNVSEKQAKRAILATTPERGSTNYAILYENEIVDNILESWITHAELVWFIHVMPKIKF